MCATRGTGASDAMRCNYNAVYWERILPSLNRHVPHVNYHNEWLDKHLSRSYDVRGAIDSRKEITRYLKIRRALPFPFLSFYAYKNSFSHDLSRQRAGGKKCRGSNRSIMSEPIAGDISHKGSVASDISLAKFSTRQSEPRPTDSAAVRCCNTR